MAVGPIQFSVSTNPIDGLNARLKALGRKEVITSIKSYPSCGACTDHDAYYIDGNGEECSYKYRQYPTDSPDRFAERFIIHLSAAEQVAKEREDRKRDSPLTFKVNSAVRADMEYQQYLDDHKAMTLGSLFGENRFPRARERAFLDFRTQAASQTRYESFDYSDPHSGAVKRVLDACLTHHLPDLSSIKCDLFVAVEHDHAVVQMSTPMPDWRKCRTIRIPLSQDMPWYTAAQQARDTLREWIDDAAQKKSDTAMAGNDCTVWIWGGVTVLKGCTWIADGEISCDSIVKDSIAAYDSAIRHVVDWGSYPSNMRVAAAQKIPAGAMVNSDGEVVGKATPARAMAYMNGVPVGALTSIDYSGTVRLDTDAEGRVTTTVQQVREAIDRSTAISVPTEDEIKQMFLDRMAQEGYKSPTAHPTLNSLASVVAASTHETYKAMERLGQDMRAGFEQSRMRFDNNNSMSEPNAGAVDNSTKLPAISIEILNEHFRLSGIQVVVKSIKAHPRIHGGYDHRAYYIGRNGEEYSFDWFQGPSELPEGFGRKFIECLIARGEMVQRNSPLDSAAKIGDTVTKETASMPTLGVNEPFSQRAKTEAIEVAYRTAAIKLPDLVRKQLVKRMASKGGKAKPSQARLSLAEEMLSGDEGSLIVAGILSLALSASPEFIKSKMPWLDLNRLATELRLNVETRIACAVADMLGMYLDGALEALKEAFGGSQQLLLAESSKPDESALFNGVPKAETVRV